MSSVHRSHRPLPWMVFGIGGFLVAFLFPVHIFVYGIAMPLGWLPSPSYHSTLALVRSPITRIYLGILLVFAFWHAGYRIRDTLCDALAMRHVDTIVAAGCFAFALAGSVATIVALCCIP
ncbi:MAG TPA: fumarate reductase subunit FrdD [Candidatus Binataceae bacterium]|nr:fumarate reductase subunit FrdD [Candidatus Binataceae bacterium]